MLKHPSSLSPQLYAETACVKWSGDGRDCSAFSLSLDEYHHLVVLKATKDGKKSRFHVNQLSVRRETLKKILA